MFIGIYDMLPLKPWAYNQGLDNFVQFILWIIYCFFYLIEQLFIFLDKGILEEIFNQTRLLKLEKKVVFQDMSE